MYHTKLRKEEYCSLDRDLVIQKPVENEKLVKELNKLLGS
jgi:hypothetical protein